VLAGEVKTGGGRFSKETIALGVVLVVLVCLSAFSLVTVARTFTIRPSNFVKLPTTKISKTGDVVTLDSVSTIFQNNLAAGMEGYLHGSSGQPVVGASVYVQYYVEGAYETQVGTTDSNGFFQIHFPINWTGWLPVTVYYFGDSQHQGLTQAVSLQGENL